jgi:hypothetical protein
MLRYAGNIREGAYHTLNRVPLVEHAYILSLWSWKGHRGEQLFPK